MATVAAPSKAAAWAAALTVAGLSAGALGFALLPARAARGSMLAILGALHGVLALATALWLRRRGLLRERLAPAYGDVTKGFVVAALLYGAAWLGARLLAGPGSLREAWLLRIYVQAGDPVTTSAWFVGLAVMAIATCEEIVWRGGVMGLLAEAFGSRRALLVSTVLYALSYAPTLVLLGDPVAGPNPLWVLGALCGGAVWAVATHLLGRLPPVALSHGLLAWALMAYPLWRP